MFTCSHNSWSGSFEDFLEWRKALAVAAGLPPLMTMEGFHYTDDAIAWSTLPQRPLFELLRNLRAFFPTENCTALADDLEGLLPKLADPRLRQLTLQFITGLREAATAEEPLTFH